MSSFCYAYTEKNSAGESCRRVTGIPAMQVIPRESITAYNKNRRIPVWNRNSRIKW